MDTHEFIDDDEAAAQKSITGGSPSFSHERAELPLLTYYPRMARPRVPVWRGFGWEGVGPLYELSETRMPPLPHDPALVSASVVQLSILVDNLKQTFRVIDPTGPDASGVYGPAIRNTLLLAAMEFESECKGILREHSHTPPRGPNCWSTQDFVKLLGPMRLREYTVKLAGYPTLAGRKPFVGWDSTAPTLSLDWYDAYNAAKHDRSTSSNRATLANAIDAVTACAIILAAQYRLIPIWRDQLGNFFEFTESPTWKPKEYYSVNDFYDPGPWSALRYNF